MLLINLEKYCHSWLSADDNLCNLYGINQLWRIVKEIIAFNLHLSPKQLYILSDTLSVNERQIFNVLQDCQQLLEKKPLDYIVSTSFFDKSQFYVDDKVLIPRYDTELILNNVLNLLPDQSANLYMLELGIGSGCVLLSLLKHYMYAKGVGVDIDVSALNVAQFNSILLGVNTRLFLLYSNMFNQLVAKQQFDVIVSNPPYIATSDTACQDAVKHYEPAIALFTNDQYGLEYYKIIFKSLRNYLKFNGIAVIEFGFQQLDYIRQLTLQYNFLHYTITYDTKHYPRNIIIYNK